MEKINHWFFKDREEEILRCFERLDERGGGHFEFSGKECVVAIHRGLRYYDAFHGIGRMENRGVTGG
jgi:hypothetical protein